LVHTKLTRSVKDLGEGESAYDRRDLAHWERDDADGLRVVRRHRQAAPAVGARPVHRHSQDWRVDGRGSRVDRALAMEEDDLVQFSFLPYFLFMCELIYVYVFFPLAGTAAGIR
jgi:hypothetical protein